MREQRPFLARTENPIQLKSCLGKDVLKKLNGFNYPSKVVDDENELFNAPSLVKHASNSCSASAGHGARNSCQV